MRLFAVQKAKLLVLTAAALLLAATQAAAQAPESSSPDNAYRAEIVLLERLVSADEVAEKMTGRVVEPAAELPAKMLVEDPDGNQLTTLQLVSQNEMHLGQAARRLVNSGRYKVLMTAAWYQSFPPDYDGEPMQVAVGDWLEAAGHREIEGVITIDRQRFLHVQVELNHWLPLPGAEPMPAPAAEPANGDAPNDQPQSVADMATGGDMAPSDDALTSLQPEEAEPKAELLTWIRETRRMRSEEIHFLDSPTIGVLVFFKKIEG